MDSIESVHIRSTVKHSRICCSENTLHAIMAAVSTAAFAFMLMVAMSMAYPVHKEKMTDQDLIKAIMYLWNEETKKDHDNRVTEAMKL